MNERAPINHLNNAAAQAASPMTGRQLAGAATWVFDLDNTLYDATTGLFSQIDARMKAFIARLLDLSEEAAFRVQKTYFREYGATLRGLIKHHQVDPRTFLDFVHDIDLSPIAPDPALDAALARTGGRKIIFTNADRLHAERVLARLGIARHFDGIFDIEAAEYVPKPDAGIYRDMIARHGVSAASAVMVEDMARNLLPAHDLGMTTLWVETTNVWGREGAAGAHVHHRTAALSDWLNAL
ncbi:pyrimidine 5'-nucleotidase [Varunaivibrio sulfuroxidans]|nr:pyrimidine 5'-nucleotidase [Varunaivibrio sulfuroxidans]WES29697.1 pyrimidine 5'-nucleotidase [Varunaivibrio sulfuroxidans]